MTIDLKYYEKGGEWYGQFDNHMDFLLIKKSTRQQLVDECHQLCLDKYGDNITVRCNRTHVPTDV